MTSRVFIACACAASGARAQGQWTVREIREDRSIFAVSPVCAYFVRTAWQMVDRCCDWILDVFVELDCYSQILSLLVFICKWV